MPKLKKFWALNIHCTVFLHVNLRTAHRCPKQDAAAWNLIRPSFVHLSPPLCFSSVFLSLPVSHSHSGGPPRCGGRSASRRRVQSTGRTHRFIFLPRRVRRLKLVVPLESIIFGGKERARLFKWDSTGETKKAQIPLCIKIFTLGLAWKCPKMVFVLSYGLFSVSVLIVPWKGGKEKKRLRICLKTEGKWTIFQEIDVFFYLWAAESQYVTHGDRGKRLLKGTFLLHGDKTLIQRGFEPPLWGIFLPNRWEKKP